MVKLQSPFLGREASGKLGTAIQYGRLVRGPSAGVRRRPHQPRTLAQRATRTFMAALAAAWNGLSNAAQQSWIDHPDYQSLSRYHCYLKFNPGRYRNLPDLAADPLQWHCFPSAVYPADESTLPSPTSNNVFTPGQGQVRHTFTIFTLNDSWLYIWHLTTPTVIWATYRTIIGVHEILATGNYDFTFKNLPAGTARVRVARVSRTGQPRPTYLSSSPLIIT